jgi:hypothetical protein
MLPRRDDTTGVALLKQSQDRGAQRQAAVLERELFPRNGWREFEFARCSI